MNTNIRDFKIWQFALFFLVLLIVSTVISIAFLGEETGQTGKAAMDLLMTGLLLLYIYSSIKMRRMEMNEQVISSAMSLGRWMKYIGATLFVKIIGIFGASTLVLLFLLAFPSIIDLVDTVLQQGQLQLERPTMFTFLLMTVSLCIFTPIWEELFFRGILFRRLALRYRTTTAAIVSSLIFGLLHFGGNSVLHAFFIGVLFCYIYTSTRNIWVPIILHGIGNFISLLPTLLPTPPISGYAPTTQELQEELLSMALPLGICFVVSVLLIKKYWPKLRNMKVVNEGGKPQDEAIVYKHSLPDA